MVVVEGWVSEFLVTFSMIEDICFVSVQNSGSEKVSSLLASMLEPFFWLREGSQEVSSVIFLHTSSSWSPHICTTEGHPCPQSLIFLLSTHWRPVEKSLWMNADYPVSGAPSYSKLSYESMFSLKEFINMLTVFFFSPLWQPLLPMFHQRWTRVFALLGETCHSWNLVTWLFCNLNSIMI